ncbi:MAG: hypothetical protein ABII12_01295 [Planctomycetota bacterium]
MQTRTHDRESCHESGVILTCYVNGRKRFRAVPADGDGSHGEVDGVGDARDSRNANRRLGVVAKRSRRFH